MYEKEDQKVAMHFIGICFKAKLKRTINCSIPPMRSYLRF